MPSTSRGFRYPAAGDAPDGPTQIHNLASDVQDELDGTLPVGGLTVTNNATVGGDLTVTDDIACDDISVGDDAIVGGDLTVNGTLTIGGVSVPANTRGKSIITTAESRTNTAYATLTTPDQVAGLVLPTDGVLEIEFDALVKESVSGAGRVGIFLGSTQLVHGFAALGVGPQPVETLVQAAGGVVNSYRPVFTTFSYLSVSRGISFDAGTGSTDYPDPTTTGWLAASPIRVEAAAGTYTVSIQYRATSGSITAKQRRLRVRAISF